MILYECAKGERPYKGRNRVEFRKNVLERQVYLTSDELVGWSNESIDFINRLLYRKPNSRLGSNGSEEVKNHPWFEKFDWKQLFEEEMVAPFVPSEANNFD